jgi:hypothetical protein
MVQVSSFVRVPTINVGIETEASQLYAAIPQPSRLGGRFRHFRFNPAAFHQMYIHQQPGFASFFQQLNSI